MHNSTPPIYAILQKVRYTAKTVISDRKKLYFSKKTPNIKLKKS